LVPPRSLLRRRLSLRLLLYGLFAGNRTNLLEQAGVHGGELLQLEGLQILQRLVLELVAIALADIFPEVMKRGCAGLTAYGLPQDALCVLRQVVERLNDVS